MSPTLMFGLIAAASPVPVAVTGVCPSAEAVRAALGSALGNEATTGVADVPRVSDHGDRFSVAVRGQIRQFVDAARDCDERARAAAVFIALALNPPVVPPAPAPVVRDGAAPPVVVPPSAAPAPTPTSERRIDLAVGARLDGGSASATSAAIGFEARAAVGWRWLGVAATAGVLAPTESQFSSVTVRQQRFPLSVALTAQRAIGQRLAVAGAVGAALVPLTLRGEGLAGSSQATRLDVGVRLAIELRIRATPRLAPFVDLHAEMFPRDYQLDVDPSGTVGSTGRLWVGVSAGLSFAVQP